MRLTAVIVLQAILEGGVRRWSPRTEERHPCECQRVVYVQDDQDDSDAQGVHYTSNLNDPIHICLWLACPS